MFLLKDLIFLFGLAGKFANDSGLSELIEKIHYKSDSATVLFLDLNEYFLDNFVKGYPEIPVLIMDSFQYTDKTKFVHSNIILVVEPSEGNPQYLDMVHQFIPQLHVRRFVIISAVNRKKLNQYFSFFAKEKFTRIFGIAEDVAYAYFPYSQIKIQKLLQSDAVPDAMQNLNGFTFRTTVEKDIPRAFWYPNKKGQPQIGGRYGQTYVNFIKRHNSTFKEIFINNSSKLSIPGIIKATLDEDIDISMNVFSPVSKIEASYPLLMEKWVNMVPVNGHLDPNDYFEMPFSSTVWVWIGITMAYTAVLKVVLKMVVESRIDIWRSISDTVSIMLRLSTETPIRSAYLLHIQELLFAFIIGNLYLIYFTSFLTVYIKVPQYDTLDDLVNNNVPIMIPDYELNMSKPLGVITEQAAKLMVPVEGAVFYKEMYSLRNTSFAYVAGEDRVEFLIGLQACYREPLFRIARVYWLQYYVAFLLPLHSPFKGILNNFIIDVKGTGLLKKWNEDAIFQAHAAGFQPKVESESQPLHVSLTLEHLRFGWNCYAFGLTIAGVVFIAERSWCFMVKFLDRLFFLS